MTTAPVAPAEMFAVDFAALAREIAMDIFPLDQVLELHRLSDEEWQRISNHPRFQAILSDISREWNSTISTAERVKVKAATGLESVLEVYIRAIVDDSIPLVQRTEAGRFLAKLGALGEHGLQGVGGSGFHITLNIGDTPPLVRTIIPGLTAGKGVIPELENEGVDDAEADDVD